MRTINKLRVLAKSIKPEVKAEEANGKTVITLSGVVGEPMWFDDEDGYFNATKVRKLIGEAKGDILIRLNSGGGDVFEGIEIFNYLKGLDNHVTIEVTALAGSAASIIAMGANELIMDVGSQMMIHRASTFGYGNVKDFEKTAEVLSGIDNSLLDIYKTKVNLPDEEIAEMIDNETWLSADEAVEKGFADKKQEVTKEKVVASVEVKVPENMERIIASFKTLSERLDKLENKKETKIKNKLFGGKK